MRAIAAVWVLGACSVEGPPESGPLDVVVDDGAQVTGSAYWADLRAVRLGRGARIEGLPSGAPIRERDADVIPRGPVDEWFRQTEQGLQQGFTVHERPAGDDWLTIDVAFDTSLTPVQIDDAWVALQGPDGDAPLAYAGLYAWDATGRELPTRMTLDCTSACFVSLSVDDSDAAYPITIDPAVTEQFKQPTPGGSFFGATVAASGTHILVGRQNVRFYERTAANAWTLVNTATVTGGLPDWYGSRIGLSGNRVAIADPFGGTSGDGEVRIFEWNGSAWSPNNPTGNTNNGTPVVLTFPAQSPATDGSARIGEDLELSSGLMIAGGQFYNDGALNTGAAFHYEWKGLCPCFWEYKGKMTNTPVAGARFGAGVGIQGLYAAIGAPGAATGGQVYTYWRAVGPTAWTGPTALPKPGSVDGSEFGAVVEMSGTWLAVGAGGSSLYLYQRSGTTWTLMQTISGLSGLSTGVDPVALTDTQLVVGLAGGTVNGHSQRGSVRRYENVSGTWTLRADYAAADGGPSDQLGYAVSLNSTDVLVGAPGETAVYSFDLTATGTGNPPGGPDNCPDNPAKTDPGVCGCVFEDRAAVGGTACVAPTAVAAGTLYDGVYVLQGATVAAGATVRTNATIHPRATVSAGADVGSNSQIGRRARVGVGCVLGSSVTVAADVSIGSPTGTSCAIGANTIVGYGASVADGAQLGPDVTVGNLATVSGTARIGLGGGGVDIGRGALVHGRAAGGASIGPDTTLAAGAWLGAGARLNRDAQLLGAARVDAQSIVGRGATVSGLVGERVGLRSSSVVPAGTCVADDGVLERSASATQTSCSGVCVAP